MYFIGVSNRSRDGRTENFRNNGLDIRDIDRKTHRGNVYRNADNSFPKKPQQSRRRFLSIRYETVDRGRAASGLRPWYIVDATLPT